MGKKLCFAIVLLFAVATAVADGLFGFFSPQGETVTVPNVVGLGEDFLELPSWAEREITYRYDGSVPAGTVTEQKPAAGSTLRIPRNGTRRLTLTVSLGAEKKTVPHVLEQDARSAAAQLREMGLAVVEKTVPGGVAGLVKDVSPAVGTQIEAGDTVTLTVSLGEPVETVTVPNLAGLSRATALMELFRCGLTLDAATEEISPAPAGTVIRQSPSAGSLVAPHTPVKITVSREASGEDSAQAPS